MKMQLYVIYDRVSQESSNIMQAKSDELALRMFDKALEGNDYISDYALYRIGNFDTEKMTGEINAVPEQVTNYGGEG